MDTLARMIALTDHFRLPTVSDEGADWYKEWHHFCILGSSVQVILNFNLCNDMRPAVPHGTLVARAILLVHERAWDGDVDTIASRDVLVRRGRIDLCFGHNTVRFRDGVFDLSVALQHRPITLTLRLRPVTLPLLRSNMPMSVGKINWLVVPRLIASGTIVIEQRVHTLREAPAYHDHNWGHWQWGDDFAWQWGFALPASTVAPWSLVFDRMTNRVRSHVQELRLALWKNEILHRLFTQDEIQVRPTGYVIPARVPKFPRGMALVAPESTTDVPRHLDITAAAGSDQLRCHFEVEDLAQIVIPHETDLGQTTINEVTGHLELIGKVKDESIMMEGRAIFEFLT
jgi:hypothetical protein